MWPSEILRKLRDRTTIQFKPFGIYWNIYGGWKALLHSIYFHSAFILTALCFPLWTNTGQHGDERIVVPILLGMVPALMGFTLAGMAIILAMSGQRFLNAIRQGGQEDSLFMQVSAVFFHFIIVQTSALIFSLLSASYPRQDWLAAGAFFLASYGVTSAIAIAAALLNVSQIFNIAEDKDENEK